jgi:hypothetical protein
MKTTGKKKACKPRKSPREALKRIIEIWRETGEDFEELNRLIWMCSELQRSAQRRPQNLLREER